MLCLNVYIFMFIEYSLYKIRDIYLKLYSE